MLVVGASVSARLERLRRRIMGGKTISMSVSEPLPFGNLLRRSRLAAGLSQEALAVRAGLGARTVSDLERGVATQPRLETVDLLATALALDDDARADLRGAARPSVLLTTAQRGRAAVSSPPGPAPLVGRERELALVTCLLDSSSHVTPPLLLLGGEPGIGKSRLLHAAAEQATARGWRVLIGICRRGGGQDPYSPLIDAVARYLLTLPPEHVRTSLKGCAWLIRLLPELGDVLEPLPTLPLPPEQERRLLFAAMARFLANIAGPAGTLLILDDLQWAGSDALDLLAALLRAPLPPPVEGRDAPPAGAANKGVPRVLGAYRDTEVRPADPLNLLATDLTREGLARQHLLGPLAPDDAAELLAGLLAGTRSAQDAALVAQVVGRAGGMPFFLVSYAQALRANQDQERGEATLDAPPWDVAQGIRLRVALRPEQTRRLLGIAAIIDQPIPWALLVTVSGLTEEEVLTGLDDACRARLLIEDEHGAYTFAHDVIREVVESDLGTARRAMLHRGIAEALRADCSGVPPELPAYHYARAGMRDKAARYLEQAGDQAWARRAPGAAEKYYHEAVDELDALGKTMDAIRVREKWAEVLYRSGQNEAVIQVLDPAAHALDAANDWERLARVLARIGWAHSWQGRTREGLARIQAVLELMERGKPPQAAVALSTLYEAVGQLQFAADRYGESLAAHKRAAEWAHAGGDDRLRVLADGHSINLLQLLGQLGEALRVGREVLPSAEAVGDHDVLRRTHCDLAYLYALRGAFTSSKQHIERAFSISTQLGDAGEQAITLTIRGRLATLCGDWQDAQADLDQALVLGRAIKRLVTLAYTQVARAALALNQGRRATATLAVREAIAAAEHTGDLQALRWAARVMAELDLGAGRTAAVIARLVPLLDRPGKEEYDVTTLLPVPAAAHLARDQVSQAEALIEQALTRARPEEMQLVLVDALRVKALAAMRREQWDEAAGGLEEGIALARSMPYPHAEARLLYIAGVLHGRKGEFEPARERLAAALALFTRLGARADAARATWALGALPGTSAALPE